MKYSPVFASRIGFAAIGLFLGSWLTNKNPNSSPIQDGIAPQETSFTRGSDSSTNASLRKTDETLAALFGASMQEEGFRRSYELNTVLRKLTPEEFRACFEKIASMEDRGLREAILVPLIVRWMAVDPATAKEALQPYRDKAKKGQYRWRSIEDAVNQAWAKAFPRATLDEAMADPNSRWAQHAARLALPTLGDGDPAAQLETLSKLPPSRLKDTLTAEAIQSLAEKDFEGAHAQLSLIANARQRSRLEKDILGKLAARDAPAAIKKVVELSTALGDGITARQLIATVLQPAAKADPKAALASLDQLPEELRSPARGSVLVGWANEHPMDALNWAVENGINVKQTISISPDSNGGAWQSLMSVALFKDREKTLSWIRALPASEERDGFLRDALWSDSWENRIAIFNEIRPEAQKDAIGPLLRGFGETGVKTAEDWVQAMQPGATRTEAIKVLTAFQVDNKGEKADSLAEAWPAGNERDSALKGIVSSIGFKDPQRGMNFAMRIQDPQLRFDSLLMVAENWLSKDERAASAWISNSNEFTADEKRVILRRFNER
jgi:hypothetical protein